MTNMTERLLKAALLSFLFTFPAFSASAAKIERGTVVTNEDYKYDNNQSLRFAAERAPNYAYYYNRGIELYCQGKLNPAERDFKRSLGGSIYYRQANAYLALTNLEQEDHRSAIRYLRRAIKDNPDKYTFRSALGLSYIKLGKINKAEAVLADIKSNKNRDLNRGATEIDINYSISVLEKALANA